MGTKEKEKIIKKYLYEILEKEEGLSLNTLLKTIKQKHEKLRLSKKTLKKIILEDNFIKIKIIPKEVKDKDFTSINKCVVCGSQQLKKIFYVDLKGNKHIVGKKCEKCNAKYIGNKIGIRTYKIYRRRQQ